MLIKEIISNIRGILSRGPVSDDTKISERQVYFILKYLRAKLIKQKADKYNYISDFNYQYIDCLPLELAPDGECECYDSGCKVLKSTWKVPRIIVNRNQLMTKGIFTQAGVEIFPATEQDLKRFKYSKTKLGKFTYEIRNDYLYVRGTERLKVVKLTAIFEDPFEANIPGACGDDVSCFDPETTDFPLDMELVEAINKLTYDEIFNVMMRVSGDNENNAADDNVITSNRRR